MSQKLHIGKTDGKDDIFDLVITDENITIDTLKREWLGYDGRYYSGPWKIMIGDLDLYKKVEPKLKELINSFCKPFPESIWFFYYKDKKISRPSHDELYDFFNGKIKRNKALDAVIEKGFEEYFSILNMIFKKNDDVENIAMENNYPGIKITYDAIKRLNGRDYAAFLALTHFLKSILEDHLDYIEKYYQCCFISLRTLDALLIELHKKDENKKN